MFASQDYTGEPGRASIVSNGDAGVDVGFVVSSQIDAPNAGRYVGVRVSADPTVFAEMLDLFVHPLCCLVAAGRSMTIGVNCIKGFEAEGWFLTRIFEIVLLADGCAVTSPTLYKKDGLPLDYEFIIRSAQTQNAYEAFSSTAAILQMKEFACIQRSFLVREEEASSPLRLPSSLVFDDPPSIRLRLGGCAALARHAEEVDEVGEFNIRMKPKNSEEPP